MKKIGRKQMLVPGGGFHGIDLKGEQTPERMCSWKLMAVNQKRESQIQEKIM